MFKHMRIVVLICAALMTGCGGIGQTRLVGMDGGLIGVHASFDGKQQIPQPTLAYNASEVEIPEVPEEVERVIEGIVTAIDEDPEGLMLAIGGAVLGLGVMYGAGMLD